MAKLLLNLRNVPGDEADEVRDLLNEHGIEFYETRPSLWGVSGGGIWIRHDEDAPEASRLMAEYQEQRLARARARHEAAVREGRAQTLWTVLRDDPARVLGLLVSIVVLVALMALPFLFLFKW